MRILQIDRKESLVKVVPETMDDLWHLERIIEPQDFVSGSTDRRIKAKDTEQKSERVNIFVTIEVEKAEFHKFSGKLRVQGIIVEGKPAELIEIKSHQALEIELNKPVTIKKKALKNYQIERLEKAKNATSTGSVLLVVLDDEAASFALLKEFELEPRGVLRSGSRGKQFAQDSGAQKKYFTEIWGKAKDIGAETIVFAGPGFEKEDLKKWLKDSGVKVNFFFAGTNSTGVTGLQELLKHDILETIVKQKQIVTESKLIEQLLENIGKNNGLAEYGLAQVSKMVEFGAVKELLVLDSFLLENRENAEALMDVTEKNSGIVHIINSEQEPGKQLDGLGGIAAILKFKMQY
ncbi:MAG: mRNA surveillance protein pelota [Candidatus Diapherotrites archaeon]|nr:mRNA surveillance protein pelota [Candidatus Diapherotrites archaeon]